MIKLRRFSLADLNQVIEIEKLSFPERKINSKLLFKKYYREYPKGFIVAKNRKKIIGCTIGRPKNDAAEIVLLAISPAWRQKGIGRKLTIFLINHFKKKRVKEIFLYARTKNKLGIAFYQGLDFKILKTIKNYYRNGDNAYLMEKKLGA